MNKFDKFKQWLEEKNKELVLCPFCGKPVRIYTTDFGDDPTIYYGIICDTDDCIINNEVDEDIDYMIKLWNKRVWYKEYLETLPEEEAERIKKKATDIWYKEYLKTLPKEEVERIKKNAEETLTWLKENTQEFKVGPKKINITWEKNK